MKIYIVALFIYASPSIGYSLQLAAYIYFNGRVEELVAGKSIIINSSADCTYSINWGGNLYFDLKSGIRKSFFFTDLGMNPKQLRIKIPTSKNIQKWQIGKYKYEYVTNFVPDGVNMPVQVFSTIKISSDKILKYVYFADKYNYIGETVMLEKGTKTQSFIFDTYNKDFYACPQIDHAGFPQKTGSAQ
jgi:hypothetical protein